jgi:hypothetical protein
MITGVHAKGDDWPKLLTLHAREQAVYFDCLVLCLLYGLENIGFVYPSMSMIVIGHLLLYLDKDGAVCSMMYDVYLTCIDDDGSCIPGILIPLYKNHYHLCKSNKHYTSDCTVFVLVLEQVAYYNHRQRDIGN